MMLPVASLTTGGIIAGDGLLSDCSRILLGRVSDWSGPETFLEDDAPPQTVAIRVSEVFRDLVHRVTVGPDRLIRGARVIVDSFPDLDRLGVLSVYHHFDQ